MVVVVAFVALAIDGFRIFSASTEKLATSDLAALAALEAFYSPSIVNSAYLPPATVSPAQRFGAAKQRAEEVAQQNLLTSRYGEPQMLTGELLSTTPTGGDSPGYIESGAWWTAADCQNCVCGAPPCFEICPNGQCSVGIATSMRVRLRTKDSAPVENVFAKVFNAPASAVASGGVAASNEPSTARVTPRHVMVLVDVGRGAQIDNTAVSERSGSADVVNGVPQPVSAILDAAHAVLVEFEASFRPRDQIGWILYDDRVDHGGLRNRDAMVGPTAAEFIAMKAALDPINAASRAGNSLLPLPDTGSDLSAAITRARADLVGNADFLNSANTIIILTNGLADDCSLKEPVEAPALNCPKFVVNSGDPAVVARQFQEQALNSKAAYDTAIAMLPATANNGIPINLNIMFFGSSAHTVLRQHPSGGSECMSEMQMRNATTSFPSILADTSAQSTQQASYANLGVPAFPRRFYSAPTWIYAMSRSLGGGWAAILPPCNVDISNACTTGLGALINNPPTGLTASFLDGSGRLFCDPRARTVADQVKDFLVRQALPPSIKLVAK